ncbi:MAG: hypothetical protein P8R54_32575 [Myxococcota bacterium]|nr:hypothetical protein [Myxococcota bacterium]
MLVLLTLSLASAAPVQTEGLSHSVPSAHSAAARALLETAALCCSTADTVPPVHDVVSRHQRMGILRMSVGHTRQGQVDYLGGTALSSQLVALDGVPLLLHGRAGLIYTRTGSSMVPLTTSPGPPRTTPLW